MRRTELDDDLSEVDLSAELDVSEVLAPMISIK